MLVEMSEFLRWRDAKKQELANALLSKQKRIEAMVFAVLEDLKQVRVKTADGHEYAITEKTPGIDWNSLHEGQHVECIVATSPLPRVIKVLSSRERE